jgi:hypothetical protein
MEFIEVKTEGIDVLNSSSPIPENSEVAASSGNQFIEQDHAYVREFLPEAAILTLSKECINVIIIRTAYARIQLKLIYIATDYPVEPPIIELSSKTLPPALLRNKEKECLEKCVEHKGKAQFAVVYEVLYRFIQTNMFIPCWKEIKQVISLCEGKVQLGVNDKEGKAIQCYIVIF